MGYVYKGKQPDRDAIMERRIEDLLRERVSLKQTINTLAGQVKAALGATPANHRRATPVCGTYSGYQKHLRDKTPTCLPCRAARAEYTRNYRARAA